MPTTANSTYDSSGDTAIEQRPLGRGLRRGRRPRRAAVGRPHVPVVAAEIDDAAVVHDDVADVVRRIAGVGSTKVHVAPASVLMARPQLVPMKTRLAFAGSIAMPKAAGSVRRVPVRQKLAGGVAVAGCVQVAPPSVLTLIPERLFARPSKNDVA